MSKRPLAALLMAAASLAASGAESQELPFFNRAIRNVEFLAGPAGTDGLPRTVVRVEWLTSVGARSFIEARQDAYLLLEVNGRVVDRLPQLVTYKGNPSGCSDSDACSGCGAEYSCYVGVPGHGCLCGKPAFTAFPPRPLLPGDRVRVRVIPGPSSVPETYKDDDSHELFFPSRNRAIERLTVEPIPGDERKHVRVEWSVQVSPALTGSASGSCGGPTLPEGLNLSVDLRLEINDTVVDVAAQDVTFAPTDAKCSPFPPCSEAACGYWIPAFTTGVCTETTAPGDDVVHCGCKRVFNGWFTALIHPDDRVRVTLVPARGGILESFTQDDSRTTTAPR